MKKRILSALLCATLAVASAVSVNAAEVKEHKGFKDLGEEIVVANNTVVGYAYNIDEDYDAYARYQSDKKDYIIRFNECISSFSIIQIPEAEECSIFLFKPNSSGGYTGIGSNGKGSFTNTGGKFKKVRIKLTEFSSMFAEGGLVENTYDSGPDYYSLKKQGEMYQSVMMVKSGSVLVQGVVPDENDEIEIFVPTKIGQSAKCEIMYRSDDDYKGGTDVTISKLRFGNVDSSTWVDVNDVTTLQLYLAGAKELDTLGLFHADVNCDNIYDVKDVTKLQIGIVEN